NGLNERNSVTVFADNLSTNTTLQWLWKVFSSVGRVVDVYLSRKSRINNPLHFACVRFQSRAEVQRAIDQYHGQIVWGCHIVLSISKFKRNDKKVNGGKPREGDQNRKAAANGTVQCSEAGNSRGHGRLYKDVMMVGVDNT
ncbi:hypothetical protein PIB30_097426, partial [Stylosanthes scabra]|nr:hypothetical protein [Stylosanthes scabra]